MGTPGATPPCPGRAARGEARGASHTIAPGWLQGPEGVLGGAAPQPADKGDAGPRLATHASTPVRGGPRVRPGTTSRAPGPQAPTRGDTCARRARPAQPGPSAASHTRAPEGPEHPAAQHPPRPPRAPQRAAASSPAAAAGPRPGERTRPPRRHSPRSAARRAARLHRGGEARPLEAARAPPPARLAGSGSPSRPPRPLRRRHLGALWACCPHPRGARVGGARGRGALGEEGSRSHLGKLRGNQRDSRGDFVSGWLLFCSRGGGEVWRSLGGRPGHRGTPGLPASFPPLK